MDYFISFLLLQQSQKGMEGINWSPYVAHNLLFIFCIFKIQLYWFGIYYPKYCEIVLQ